MKTLFIIDAIAHIQTAKDSSFALMLAAQNKQWPIHYCEINDLFLQDSTAYAFIKNLQVKDQANDFFNAKEPLATPLTDFDLIFMRKDPPVDQAYWHATQILDFAEQAGVRVINKPASLRTYNEKLATQYFPQLCPETLVSASADQAFKFIQQHKEVICKPLDGMGGQGIFKMDADNPEALNHLNKATHSGINSIICQRYLPEITQGDKRLIMINGKPLPYGLRRMPPKGKLLANLAAGGTGEGFELDKHDLEICEQVGPFLRDKGLFLVGLDVIGTHLTEINITSPTCLREISAAFDIDVAEMVLEAL